MTSTATETPPPHADSWNAYWKGTAEAETWSAGGARHPAVRGFWGEFFTSVGEQFEAPSILDIGSGNGAVVEYALAVLDGRVSEIHCVDYSQAAIASIGVRFPQVSGHVSDASSIPLETGRFDIVTSQFGAEYAGHGAFEEAARLLAENGRMALLLHCREGQIHRQYELNLEAVGRVQECHFVDRAHRMFEAGFAALQGADRAPYEQAAEQLAPAVEELESIMAEHGQEVANDTIATLYGEVARFHSRIQYYDPDEVLAWLKRMDRELEAYRGRIESMVDAAVDLKGFQGICEMLTGRGLTLEQHGPLLPRDSEIPLAWAILAQNQEN